MIVLSLRIGQGKKCVEIERGVAIDDLVKNNQSMEFSSLYERE
jgi:uncharacterized protein (UPF0262 family)